MGDKELLEHIQTRVTELQVCMRLPPRATLPMAPPSPPTSPTPSIASNPLHLICAT